MGRDSGRGGAGGSEGSLQVAAGRAPKGKGRAGCSLLSKGKGVQVFSAVRTQKNKNKHMRSPQAPQTVSAKCAQEPQWFQ